MATLEKNTAFDPLEFCEEIPPVHSDDARRFVVDIDRMYPAVVKAIADGGQCSTEDEEHYRAKIRRARSLTQGLVDALAECQANEVERDQDVIVGGTVLEDGSVAGGKTERRKCKVNVPILPCESLPDDRIKARAVVLETARLWFTNELQHAVGGRIEIKLTGSKRWKLGTTDILV